MNDAALVKAAVCLMRTAHERPSASSVAGVLRLVCGRSLRKTDLCRLIKSAIVDLDGAGTAREPILSTVGTGNRSGTNAELSGTAREPILSTVGTGRELSGTGPEHHARVKTTDIETETRDETPSSSRPVKSKKRVIVSEPEAELPECVLRDYQRLLANDARTKKGNALTEKSIEDDERMLRRAFEKRGLQALEHGIEIALRKNLGVAYAAGCVRRYDNRADEPQLSLVGGSGNHSFSFRRSFEPERPRGPYDRVPATPRPDQMH